MRFAILIELLRYAFGFWPESTAYLTFGAMYAIASLLVWAVERAECRWQVIEKLEARVGALEGEVARLDAIVANEIEAAEFWGDALEIIANDNEVSEARRVAREALSRQPIDRHRPTR